MTRVKLGICDEDRTYANKIAAYLLSKEGENFEPLIFSNPQQALMDQDRVDICLTSYDDEEFFEKMKGKAIRIVERNDRSFSFPQLEKYRSMSNILGDIRRILETNTSASKDNKTQITVVCSPISHELQMLFSMCMCKEMSINRKVIYLNLKECSGFYQVFGDIQSRDLEDLMTVIQKPEVTLEEYVYSLHEVDLLLPPRRPESFWEVDDNMVTEVMSLLSESDYEEVVIDLNNYFPGSYTLLSLCDRVIGLTRDGFIHNRIYQEWEEAMSFHLGDEFLKKVKCVNLPLQSGGIKDSEFLLDELYRGNLGDYAREAING